MRIHSGYLALTVALGFSSACSLFHRSTTPQANGTATADRARAAHLYTDSDVVTGVASTPTAVFVATATRGVLRYPIDGGQPSRMTVHEGLPDDHIYALSVGPDRVLWVATPQGVARLATDRWGSVGYSQPDVGRATAILALDGGNVLLGGSQGIARFDGARWSMLTDQYQVMGFTVDQGRILVATAQNGVVALADDATSVDEYGTQSGIPDALVRAVVPVGPGRFWALVQGPGGSRLAYFDGHRWFGYTHGTQRGRWMALVKSRRANTASLLVDGRLFDIVSSGGEPLVALEASTPDQHSHLALHPAPVEGAPAAPPAQRGRNGSAAANQPSVPHSGPRPRNIPPFGQPVDTPDPASVPQDAPHFALAPAEGMGSVTDAIALYASGSELFAARPGLGVSRIAGGDAANFRTRDLSVHDRPLALATDTTGAVWVVTDDHGVVRFDGERFGRSRIDPDDSVVPLMFWSRGPVAAAVARIRPNVIGAYRFADSGWQQVSTRRVDLGGPGQVDARFLALDDRGRFWVGLRVDQNGTMHDRGVVLIDGNLPRPMQFNARVGAHARRGRGLRAPDDLAAIDFDNDGTPWFAGVTGATHIIAPEGSNAGQVQTFGEAQGVRGDVVADVARGPGGGVYVATPDGLGRYNGSGWDFALPGASGELRALALATDVDGNLWGAGPRGVWRYDGRTVTTLARADGLPEHPVNDVAVDGQNRVWLSTEDGITILARGTERQAGDDLSESSGGEE
jgi:ligand-binding sensor domain-containing protein